jgi:shikimate dehydrogenase
VSRRTACLIGWPVKHTRSPLVHRYWLAEYGIDGDYVAVAVEPARAAGFFSAFAESGFVGGNVTVPHKETAFRAVKDCDDNAKALKAVNTIWLEDQRLIGCNTDAFGFLANLDQATPGWSRQGETALVLGAGGAARAVVWALLGRGFDPVVVVNRTVERAEMIAIDLGPRVRPASWETIGDWLPRTRLLVNSTSLGMAANPPLVVDLKPLPRDAVVQDLVYVPLETPLLRQARSLGLTAVDGLGMLLHQAVPGFEKWFGRRPEVTERLRAHVARDILAAQ